MFKVRIEESITTLPYATCYGMPWHMVFMSRTDRHQMAGLGLSLDISSRLSLWYKFHSIWQHFGRHMCDSRL